MTRFFRYSLALLTAAVAFTGSAAFAALPSVLPGYELLTTVTGPTIGGAQFTGVPLGNFNFGPPANTQATGTTDTIVKRLNTVSPGSLPGSGTTPIEMVALQLVSIAPVDLGLGTDFYYLTLQSARGGPASTGTMTILFDGVGNPDTFSSSIDVFYDIRKGSLVGPIGIANDAFLTSNPATWSRTAPAGALTIPDVNLNLNGNNTLNDFWPAPITVTGWPGVSSFDNTSTPEPASLALLVLAAPCLLRRRTA